MALSSTFEQISQGGRSVAPEKAADLDPHVRERLLELQVSSIYGHVAKAAFISTLIALALAVYLAPEFGAAQAQAWFLMKAVVSAARFGLSQAYRSERLRSHTHLAGHLLVGSLVLDGLIWGFAGVWGANARSEVVCLVITCLSSVAMLATFGLQVWQRATAAYVVPMLAPVAIAMAMRGDALGAFFACGMMLVVAQTLVTGFASEKRLRREFLAHERTAEALQERSSALQAASQSKAELEVALERASKTSSDLEIALDQVKRQSAVKALFLGTMSHELRTPLHGILGLTELVRKQVSEPVAKHRLELIESSGTHLLELIGALLDVSRIDSGKLELHPAPFDLALELRDLSELYELRCQAKGVAFKASFGVAGTCWVRGDAARIRQVLHNLLGNAVKFIERGLVRFKVSEEGGIFVFEIADTGPGIADRDLPHIFEAFRQVDETASRPADGTGLGLTIARELAQAMGGDISVSSVAGVGSRFTFTARLERAAAASIPVAAKPQAHPTPRLRDGYRVLLVEDNEVNALIANAHLEQLGAQTRRAHDGREAVTAAFTEPRPDLILMDCRMPVMDGLTATREIRAIERSAGIRGVPIVALTATPSDEDRKECFAAGMNDFLTKPFTLDQLLGAIGGIVTSAAPDERMKDHPLYEFAQSLDDMEPDLFDGLTMH
ncbi:MAG: response regulator [Burkholderiales bacterium]|nr:response regulator [Burkholderiales bacterium]